MTRRHGRRLLTPLLLAALSLGACGDDGRPTAPPGVSQSAFERRLAEAQTVSAADFPSAAGKTLEQLANTAQAGNQLGLAASVFVPGENRLAFGVLDAQNRFVYGKTAVYSSSTTTRGCASTTCTRARSPTPPHISPQWPRTSRVAVAAAGRWP